MQGRSGMKTELRMIGTGLLAAGLLAGSALAERLAAGQEQPAKPAMCKGKDRKGADGERSAFQEQQKERMKAHFESQRAAGKTVMEAVKKEEDAHKALAMIREHRVAARAANEAFFEEQWERRMTEVGQRFEAKNVPMEKREELLKKMVAERGTRKAESDARYTAMLAALDELAAKADLTKDDIRAVLKKDGPGRGGKGPGNPDKPRHGKMHKDNAEGGEKTAPAASPAI